MFAICGRGLSAARPLPCLVDVGQPDWALPSLPPRGRGSGSAVPLNEACQMEKNAIIAAVLSLAVLIGWQMLVLQPMQEKGEKKRQERKAREESTGKKTRPAAPALSQPLPGSALPAPIPSPTKGVAPPAKVPAAEERRVRVDVGSAVYEFTNRGAGLVSARLLRHPENICKPSLLFSQKCVKGRPLELVVGGGPAIRPFFFAGGDTASELNRSVFRIEGRDMALTPSKPGRETPFCL